MALTTLPYPSLDFVPLDILTAEEMNQIVANYTAINNATIGTSQLANSSITTSKLANKAVTSDKVDWTTLKATRADASWLSVPGGTFTPTTTCFIIASYACAFGMSVYVNDGDTRIFSGRQQTASGYSWGAFSALLFKGHTYTFTRDNDGNAQWQGASVYTIS